MSKETSSRVASKAAHLNRITAQEIEALVHSGDKAGLEDLAAAIRSVAVSDMVQREPGEAPFHYGADGK